MPQVSETLDNREKIYGSFEDVALVAQNIKAMLANAPSYGALRTNQREALDMIVSKIARIVCGNPNYADNWHDIGGYARLAEESLADQSVNQP